MAYSKSQSANSKTGYKKQEPGGDCMSSPGDKIKGSVLHKVAGPKRLDSMGGSAKRGSGNMRKS